MYKSPLHILADLNAEASEISDPAFLLRVRKKLLAEFNLSDLPTIEINGKTYSKDEVIKIIDVLMGNPQMPMHTYVFAHKTLLDFLENDHSYARLAELKETNVPEEIAPMLSSVMLERLVFNLKKSFHTRNFDRASELIVHTPLLTEEDHEHFLEELNKNLLSLQDQIELIQAKDSEFMERDLKFLSKNSFAVFLNNLPSDFSYTLDALVAGIINTMVAYQKRKGHHRAFLYEVSVMLCKVNCDPELMKLVKNNHEAFSQNNGKTTSWNYRQGAGIAIFILVFVVRILVSTCSREVSSNDYDFSNSKITYLHPRYDEFEAYRSHILGTQKNEILYGRKVVPAYMSENTSGSNPFLQILKENENPEYTGPGIRKVLLKNKTKRDLIVVAFDQTANRARAFYFYQDIPDTLVFYQSDHLCLYFGDSLSYVKSTENDVPAVRMYYEVYFKSVNKKTFELLANDYKLTVFKNYDKAKKTLPELTLTNAFFETQLVEDSRFILSRVMASPKPLPNDPLMESAMEERRKN